MREPDLRQTLTLLGVRNLTRTSSNGWISFPCPLAPWTHKSGSDKRASAAAVVDEKKPSSWSCQGCKSHGTVRKLAYDLLSMRDGKIDDKIMLKIEQAEAGALLHSNEFGDLELADAPLPEPVNEAMIKGLYMNAHDHEWGREYLTSHRRHPISPATAEKIGLVYDDDDSEHRILFPVRAGDGKFYGFSGRAVQSDRQPKIKDYFGLPKRHLILGEDRWRSGMPKIIVEGLFAYAHLHEIGVEDHADIGALLGSALTKEKRDRIIAWGDATYMLVDNDTAGDACLFGRIDAQTKKHQVEEGAIAALEGYVPVMVPDWPEREDGTPKEDPDELTLDEVLLMLQGWPYVLDRKKFK